MARIGVFVCWCGANIAERVVVQEVARAAAELPEVVHAEDYKFLCSGPGQDIIAKAIKEKQLDGVVIASCSPRMHETTYRRVVKAAGLNQYLMEMANIREHVSWVTPDRAAATAKAIDLVRMKVKKVAKLHPLDDVKIPVTKRALVIGGGVAGIQAALDIAEAGHDVILVEKEPSIGGHMSQLDETFPTLDCSQCILTPKMVDVAQNQHIKLMSYSEVESISGFVGNFKVRVRRKARYVDEKECTGCGDCAKVCPVTAPNAFDAGLSERTAIYRPFPQAVPGAYVVDKQGEAPCVQACPAGVNVQGYMALTAQGKYAEALAVIRRDNPFPAVCGRVCTHPCEAKCNRAEIDEPLAIAQVKRFLADYEVAHPVADAANPFAPAAGVAKDEAVAVIGAGPAGLAAAANLRRFGYRVTVFERDASPGGLLRSGIPAYRLPKDALDREIELIREAGVDIRVNQQLGRDFTLDSLERDGYKAIFAATGAQKSRRLGVPGEDGRGVVDAVSFLRQVARGEINRVAGSVAVIGGGNSAIDAARTALRLGAKSVRILYRRNREDMPADVDEIADALAEGVTLETQVQPVSVRLEDGVAMGIVCIKTRPGEPDASGRRRPEPIPGSDTLYEAGLVINAAGQVSDFTALLGADAGDAQVNEWGMVQGRVGLFAGGDLVLGPATVVEAIAAGKRAALAIDSFIAGTPLPEEAKKPAAKARVTPGTPKVSRIRPSHLAAGQRTGSFAEVVASFTEDQVRAEASRCLNCAVCSSCRECEKVCQRNCIHHDAVDEIVEEDVGAIVVATGYQLFDPSVYTEYGYGRYPDVVTSLEFERLCSSTGPTGGHVRRPSDGAEPKTVVFLQCVGSRDDDKGHPYCSKTCCMYTAKHTMLLKAKVPDSQSYVFYIDIRAAGKGYEEFVRRAIEEDGACYLRGRVGKIIQRGSKLIVRGEDTLVGRPTEIEADMVVLATAMEPQTDAAEVARRLGISYDEHAFFTEAHPKLRPSETNTAGIYLAGACQAPRDIPDSVAGGSAAAAKVLALLAQPQLVRSPFIAGVDRGRCTGCFTCKTVCPFDAIDIEPQRNGSLKAKVNTGKCQGCGLCTATCRNGAIDIEGFTAEQVMEEVESL